MTAEPPIPDRYVYLGDKLDEKIPDAKILPKARDLRAQLIQREEVYHGTSIDSLFILLLLGAMSSVVLRELAIHGPDATIPVAGVWGLFVGLAVLGAVASLLVALAGRLTAVQCLLRTIAGILVGLSAGALASSPTDSQWKIMLLTTLGSLMLILFAILFARWRIQSQLNLDSEIEKSLEEV